MTDRASAEGLRAEYGETAMDGPNTHKMDAPFDVTSWTVIPTTRDVPSDDGRRMEPRNEWWHVPAFVVEAIEAAAAEAERARIRAAVEEIIAVLGPTPPDCGCEGCRVEMQMALDNARAVLAAIDAPDATPDRADPARMSDAAWVIQTLRDTERTEPTDRFWEGWDAALAAMEVALRATPDRADRE